ncbi:MAG: TraB/GumN family protein [Candidatus Competibacterales bacterium]
MGAPRTGAGRLRVWFAAALLHQAPARPPPGGEILDARLQRQAEALAIPVEFLEDFTALARRYRAHLSAEQQWRLLAEGVCNAKTLAMLYRRQVAAYAAGDLTAFFAQAEALGPSDPGLAQVVQRVLIDRRNAAFWRTLEQPLGRGATLVAVGASHVVGPGGLVARLKAAGATVTPLTLHEALAEVAGGEVTLPETRLAATRRWLAGQGLTWITPPTWTPVAPETLRARLCPGRLCRVDATYLPSTETVLLAHGVYAQLLQARSVPYAESLLVREGARHALSQEGLEPLTPLDPALAHRCLRREILHRASWLQGAFLAAVGAPQRAQLFPRDGRCPAFRRPRQNANPRARLANPTPNHKARANAARGRATGTGLTTGMAKVAPVK